MTNLEYIFSSVEAVVHTVGPDQLVVVALDNTQHITRPQWEELTLLMKDRLGNLFERVVLVRGRAEVVPRPGIAQ